MVEYKAKQKLFTNIKTTQIPQLTVKSSNEWKLIAITLEELNEKLFSSFSNESKFWKIRNICKKEMSFISMNVCIGWPVFVVVKKTDQIKKSKIKQKK